MDISKLVRDILLRAYNTAKENLDKLNKEAETRQEKIRMV